jgi:hypothetical protein
MGVARPIAAMSRCVTGGAGVDDVRGMCWLHIFQQASGEYPNWTRLEWG